MGISSFLCLLVAGGGGDAIAMSAPMSPLHSLPAPQEAPVGTWKGTLTVSGTELPIVFHVSAGDEGGFAATMDSPAQGATGIPVTEVVFEERHLRLFVAAAQGEYEGDLSADGETLDGTWSQGGREFPLVLERMEGGVEPPSRPQEPEPPLPYDTEEVRVTNAEAGITLAGTLTLPREPGPHPAVVLVSGSGPQDRDETVFGHRPFLVLADHLTREGFAVLRYDDRGVGESEGDFAPATSEDFVTDVLAAVAYLGGRDEVANDAIGIIGHSEGGLVAPLAAVASPDVGFIVMMAGPGVTGREIILEQGYLIGRAAGSTEEALERNRELQEELFAIVAEEPDPEAARTRLEEVIRARLAEMTDEEREAAGLTGETEAQVIRSQVRQVNSRWMRFFLSYDPVPTLRRVRVPVLAVNGELDLQVPPEQNLPAIEAALTEGGNPDHTVLELEGLNHLFQTATSGSPGEYVGIEETISPTALNLISEWILERFGS